MNTTRRYSITEAAPLLWFSVEAFMQILRQYPKYIETSLDWGLYKEKGISLEDAQRDPDCVMIAQAEIARLKQNQLQSEKCGGCGNVLLLQALTPHWIGGERVYVCEECQRKSTICSLCDNIILEEESAYDRCEEGVWEYYHSECWKIMNEKEK